MHVYIYMISVGRCEVWTELTKYIPELPSQTSKRTTLYNKAQKLTNKYYIYPIAIGKKISGLRLSIKIIDLPVRYS